MAQSSIEVEISIAAKAEWHNCCTYVIRSCESSSYHLIKLLLYMHHPLSFVLTETGLRCSTNRVHSSNPNGIPNILRSFHTP